MSNFRFIKTIVDEGIFEISLNRTEARNALSEDVRSEIREAIARSVADNTVRVVLIRGEGDHFCAGADINELDQRRLPSVAWAPDRLDNILEECGKPTIAAMQGYTLGGGLELALSCTLRIVSEDFRGGLPEIRLGIFPALGGTVRLAKMVGESRAISLILTGRTFSASEAEAWGLATRVVAPDSLREESWKLARSIARRPPVAVRTATESVRNALGMSRRDAIDYERKLFGIVCATEDKEEGVRAWQEKREATFTGR